MTAALGVTDKSIATASTANTEAVALNTGRIYLLIQNVSDVDVYVRFGAAASATVTAGAGSLKLVPGAVHEWIGTEWGPSGSVNIVTASGTGKSVVIWEG